MLLSTLATLGQVGATIYSKAKQRQLNNASDRIEADNYRNTDRILQSNLRSDYTSRTDFQNILSRQKALLDQQWKRVQGAQAIAGSSGGLEAGAAQKQANALSLADTSGALASGASNYKDYQQRQAIANNASHANYRIARNTRQASDISNANSQVQGALSGLYNADDGRADAVLSMFGLGKQVAKKMYGKG